MYKYLVKKESLLVAGSTAALYAAVYFYERGAASEMNIPLDLITVSIPTISNDIMEIFIFIMPLLIISASLVKWAGKSKKKRAVAHLGISGAYLVEAYLTVGRDTGALLLFGFNWLVLFHLLSQWIPLDTESKNGLSNKSDIRAFGFHVLNFTAILFFFSLTFIGLGRSSVYNSEFTTFIIKDKEYAIAKVYGENVFTWSVNNGEVIHHLTYFRMENISGLDFEHKKFKKMFKKE